MKPVPLLQVAELLRRHPVDYVIVESTGMGEPLPIAAAFHATGESGAADGPSIADYLKIDTMVTLIDAPRACGLLLGSNGTLLGRGSTHSSDSTLRSAPAAHQDIDGQRDLATLLVEQVEFADVILLNKCDLVSDPEKLQQIEQCIRGLNPSTKLIRSTFSEVAFEEVINTGRYDDLTFSGLH